jgi:hypothetical protein
MITPVALAMGFGAFLMVLEGPTPRGLLLLLLVSPFFYLGAEILARKIAVDTTGITISKFLRSVHLEWSEIQSLDAVRSGSKLSSFFSVRKGPVSPPTRFVHFRTWSHAGGVGAGGEDLIAGRTCSRFTGQIRSCIQAWLVSLVFVALVVGETLGYGE